MNKSDLIGKIAKKTGMTKKDVDNVLNGFLGEVTQALSSGERVQLIGFGTFQTRSRSARTGRNPQTGSVIKIKASTIPAFKAGNKLREAVK
jgi:DNA-binding protein HU-beta